MKNTTIKLVIFDVILRVMMVLDFEWYEFLPNHQV